MGGINSYVSLRLIAALFTSLIGLLGVVEHSGSYCLIRFSFLLHSLHYISVLAASQIGCAGSPGFVFICPCLL
jgi:hypothetical protein